jgi:hypothetical protein
MRSTTITNLRRRAEDLRYGFILILAVTVQLGCQAREAEAQTGVVPSEAVRQVPAPLPKLALNGAAAETMGRTHYHKVILTITNWDRYSSEMFAVPHGRKLPPNPCADARTRIVLSVYSERGALIANCIAMPKPADLGRFAFLIQKGKAVPEYVYAVITDRHTGAVYRSNLVSPSGGATK